MAKYFLIFTCFFFLFGTICPAQDERYFRELFSQKNSKQNVHDQHKSLIAAQSRYYQIDLDQDGYDEGLVIDYRDGQCWLKIFDKRGDLLKEFRFESTGPGARIYKILVSKISNQTKVLLVHFYEGYTDYIEFRGTARLYFITIDSSNIKTLSLYKGPTYWEEREVPVMDHYYKRKYFLNVFDYNNDGVKEISVKYHTISQVFMYNGNGNWLTL